ncbi:sucrose-phosphatase 2-like [Prosopis cineraria]|uniref:sucrose-phosphatase 2-like n=1 Tax=Prosopis cineraria TaxID=364024 RepID=UPI002410AEA3|nr:sucrose-phosphatase 2-like [Prosopis cineraria]XP_054787355.1 sucrose-phosphatase 2-like [Prosopis cineraria]
MDRLNDSPNLMIVSDLDCTMVDHDDPGNLALLRFNALWEAYYRRNSLLVFSTGRSPTSYRRLRKKRPLLTPDITIMSVGTEIAYGESMVPDDDWKQYLDNNWDRKAITEETAKFPELIPQPETEHRPHKVSFYVEKGKASEVILALSKCLEKRRLDVKIIYSSGTALDLLPQGAGKGQALAYILEKFKADGRGPINTLVCGDSGNDAELFSVPEVYGVMVSNSQEELLQWYANNAKGNPKIIHATERCSAGIIQAIGNFSVGPNLSPRDIVGETVGNFFSREHEVVKFYIFYERWRRGEIENSEQNVQTLKSTFHHAGSFVHPSGVEKNRLQILDAFEKFYGDKQGISFQVWVDRVNFAEISLGSWQVKFDKWELSGKGLQGCSTKVLMNSKVDSPDEFIWMHLHQTWLDGSGQNDDDKIWFI